MDQKNDRDRGGEPFQNETTENTGARRPQIEEAQHELKPDTDIDSQEADAMNPEFARRLNKD